MVRVNRVMNNVLDILRAEFADRMEGGSLSYNGLDDNTPLRWDRMTIQVQMPDLDEGRDTGEVDNEGYPVPDTSDVCGFALLPTTDTTRITGQNHLRFPSTDVELNLIVWASIKDENNILLLVNAQAAVAEKLLWDNQGLTHPETGDEAATSVSYLNSETDIDTGSEGLLPVAIVVQTWEVSTNPNKRIELKP